MFWALNERKNDSWNVLDHNHTQSVQLMLLSAFFIGRERERGASS